jgi:hypothetical protein
MKNIFKILLLLLLVSSCCPKKVINDHELIILQKSIKSEGITFVLKSIVNDSRCPEGVNCVWAGEVEAVVLVYKNNVLVEESNLVFSSKNNQTNIDWFMKYTSKKIKSIRVLPYPKDGVKINPKEYFIKIDYSK